MSKNQWGSALTDVNTVRTDTNGAKREINGKEYRYCRAGNAFAKGAPVSAYAPTDGTFSDSKQLKVTDSATVAYSAKFLGIAISAGSTSQYCWIQTGGVNDYATTDGSVADGDLLIKDQATDGMIDTMTNTGTQAGMVIGTALAADSGSVCPSVLLYGRM